MPMGGKVEVQALAASLAVEVRLWQVVGWLVVCEGLTKRSDYGTPWCVLCEACWSACCSEWEEEWETGFFARGPFPRRGTRESS
mgnify:CR=1 FL=1